MKSVTMYAENRVTIGLEGGISAALTSMRQFPDDQEVLVRVLGSLANLSCNSGTFVCT